MSDLESEEEVSDVASDDDDDDQTSRNPLMEDFEDPLIAKHSIRAEKWFDKDIFEGLEEDQDEDFELEQNIVHLKSKGTEIMERVRAKGKEMTEKAEAKNAKNKKDKKKDKMVAKRKAEEEAEM